MIRKRIAIAVFILIALIVGFIFVERNFADYGTSSQDRATFDAVYILKACNAYAKHPATSGQPPMNLAELIEPKFGGRAFLDGGQAAITDPWGRPFRYANVPNDRGEMEYYVWAERNKNNAISIYGAKLTSDGTVLSFGK